MDVLKTERSDDMSFIPEDTEVFISRPFFTDSAGQIYLSNLPNLKKLYLSYYSLAEASELVIEHMPNLQHISISSNCLEQAALVIRNCSRLSTLMINDNSFRRSPSLVLQGLAYESLWFTDLPALESFYAGINSFQTTSFVFQSERYKIIADLQIYRSYRELKWIRMHLRLLQKYRSFVHFIHIFNKQNYLYWKK